MPTPPENPSPDATPEDVARIDFELACVHCTKSLAGAPLDGACPTCSEPVADTLAPDAIDLATATVSADVPCPQCGYNLRTLSISGICPECAHAVAPALHRHPLSGTDPAWRKRVLSGIRLLFFVIIATPVSTIAIVILTSLGLTIPGSFDILMTFAIRAILLAGLAAGIFAVSARSEKGFNRHASAWPHIVARTGILLSLILFILAHGVLYLITTGSSHAISHVVIGWITIGSSIFHSASLIAAGLCLRRIARLARDARLIKRTNTWLVLYAIAASLGIVVQIIGMFTPIFAMTASGPEKILVAIQIFTGLAGLIAFVLAIFALLAYRKLLRSADTRRASDVRWSSPRPHARA